MDQILQNGNGPKGILVAGNEDIIDGIVFTIT